MFLSLVHMREFQISQFAPAHPQPSKTARIARSRFPLTCWERVPVRTASLFGREPVSKPHSLLLDVLHAPNAGIEFRSEQTGIGSLVANRRTAVNRPLN